MSEHIGLEDQFLWADQTGNNCNAEDECYKVNVCQMGDQIHHRFVDTAAAYNMSDK